MGLITAIVFATALTPLPQATLGTLDRAEVVKALSAAGYTLRIGAYEQGTINKRGWSASIAFCPGARHPSGGTVKLIDTFLDLRASVHLATEADRSRIAQWVAAKGWDEFRAAPMFARRVKLQLAWLYVAKPKAVVEAVARFQRVVESFAASFEAALAPTDQRLPKFQIPDSTPLPELSFEELEEMIAMWGWEWKPGAFNEEERKFFQDGVSSLGMMHGVRALVDGVEIRFMVGYPDPWHYLGVYSSIPVESEEVARKLAEHLPHGPKLVNEDFRAYEKEMLRLGAVDEYFAHDSRLAMRRTMHLGNQTIGSFRKSIQGFAKAVKDLPTK